MFPNIVCYYLFLFISLELVSKIHPSLHGHNNAFSQTNNEVQYLLDNIRLPMHKEFARSVDESRQSVSDEHAYDTISHIQFEPNILDFKERQLGVPYQETVTLYNRDYNKTIHLSSISGNTQHFHASFFQDKVIPPLGNTTFNVVFLGREEGDIDSFLFIHTSDGTLKYQVKGVSVSSPYRLQPVVGIKLPLNASFTPLIYMHNPHNEPLQVVEVFSSGGEFQLELPSGQAEGRRELWEIPPYHTKPIIRLHFNAYTEKNHTTYIRFKVNISAEILVVAVEVEVGSGAGLHWGENSGVITLGMGGTLQPPIRYPITLKNSAKKSVKVLNIISTPVSKALKVIFEPVTVPGDTETPVNVGTLIYDWKAGHDLRHFRGKLVIKGIGPGGTTQKLAIPWVAEVLSGGLEVNTSVTHYRAPYSLHPRNFSVINKYKIPLAITNVSLSAEAKNLFLIINFRPKILEPNRKANLFMLQLSGNKKYENLKLESSIIIQSNISTTEVPLFTYDGKVRKIIPDEDESNKGAINFGTVGSGTETEAVFALENHNPINFELHGWGVNMPGAVLELMGCQSGPSRLFNKCVHNISACSHIGNQSIKPGYLAVFKIKVKTGPVEEDTIIGEVFVRTSYERLTVPVLMRVAHGRISVKKLATIECFPGATCVHKLKVQSTFTRPMEVTSVAPCQKDHRIKFVPLDEMALPIVSKGENSIGAIEFDPSVTCKQHCYLGLSLNTSAGNQWFTTLNLPSHTRDSDLNLLNTRYTRYLNSTGGGPRHNITIRLDTTEVRGHKFNMIVKHYWPSLLGNSANSKNESTLIFPLTQVGNTSYETIKIYNPSSSPLLVQLVMDWSYPQGLRLFHSLPNKFKPICSDCPATIPGEFKLEVQSREQEMFTKQWNIPAPAHTSLHYLLPHESKTVHLSYTPSIASSSSALLYIRNNMTILEILRLVGRGAHAQFKFGNRKPGSTTPLLFELADKHLKDCTREKSRRTANPNLTVKRSFTARNTGELPIDVHGFSISGLKCEGYGFKVLNCVAFKLNPNDTRKIEIAFTPDFTLSRVERELHIMTSLGTDIVQADGVQESGLAKLSLLTTVPVHSLESCAAVLTRPSWEQPVRWAAINLSVVLLICILALSFLEADKILRGALANLSKSGPVQPPLDLRILSDVWTQAVQTPNSPSEKLASEDRAKPKKDGALPDWSLMNVKKIKERDAQRGMKIPDWTVEEERRFKVDTETKEATPPKKLETSTVAEPINPSSNTVTFSGTKKKNNKKQATNCEPQTTESPVTALSMPSSEAHVPQEKKYSNITLPRSSPTGKKSKPIAPPIVKEDAKPMENEVATEINTAQLTTNSNTRTSKAETKRKHETNNNNSQRQHNNRYKKYEVSNLQKMNQFSEEETSSSTTESSVHEDTVSFKNSESKCVKSEIHQRKPAGKKPKVQTTLVTPTIDYRDNYEGDCDDDDYDKERHDNPNRWKTSTARSNAKHHHHSSRCNNDLSFKLPHQNKNAPRKENTAQKRRTADKAQAKCKPTISLTGGLSQGDNVRLTQSAIAPPHPPPPSYWGENRAKFSDVVARNQDNVSMFSAPTSPNISTKPVGISSLPTHDKNMFDIPRPNALEEMSNARYNSQLKFFEENQPFSKDKLINQQVLLTTPVCHSNSYFINTFAEPSQYESELVPYELPETDEPLVELECLEPDTSCSFWNDSSPMKDLPGSNSHFQSDTPRNVDKISNSSDTFKDNWATVDPNWEPLYTRGAVGEERSGVWGVNTGGVWTPWGASAPSTSSIQIPTTSRQTTQEIPDHSRFDPFQSLSTIWTPSLPDPWKSINQSERKN